MRYSDAFERAFTRHLDFEGGYVNDPMDPGGETKYGISKRYNPDVDVANLTVNGAKVIYYNKYWLPMRLDSLESGSVAEEMFDAGAGPNGPGMAIKIAQGAISLLGRKVVVDGKIGPQTIAALNAYPHVETLVKLMNCLQFTAFLLGSASVEDVIKMARKRKPLLRHVMRGWLKRIQL